jgi:predicted HD phosphohydrolase
MKPLAFTTVADLEDFLRDLDASPSDEAGLTELEHLLQCAEGLREAAPHDRGLQVAGLLHDIGWSLDPSDGHGAVGAAAVRDLVGERVAELIRLHVDAKRYLVTTDRDYRARLSQASLATLRTQGGDMTPAEIAAFEASPFHRDAIQLRVADDLAKVPGKSTTALEAWLPVLRSATAR